MRKSLEEILGPHKVSLNLMKAVMENLCQGHYNESQMASILTAIRFKGITIDELMTANDVFLKNKKNGFSKEGCTGIYSTGGGFFKAFNVSTIATIIASASGVNMVKHIARGYNYSMSSLDLLEALGISFAHDPHLCVEKLGLCFYKNSEFSHLHAFRKSLGVPTIMDLLFAVLGAFDAEHSIIGVSNLDDFYLLAQAFQRIGDRHILLVRGEDGMDEITLTKKTRMIEIKGRDSKEFYLCPEDFGCTRCIFSDLEIKDIPSTINLFHEILEGKKCPATDLVLMNAAALLYLAGTASDFHQGKILAEQTLYSGKAKQKFNDVLNFSS